MYVKQLTTKNQKHEKNIKLFFIASVAICFSFSTMQAQTIIESGTTGDLTWTLTSDSVMTISGNGEMDNLLKKYTDKGSLVNKRLKAAWNKQFVIQLIKN